MRKAMLTGLCATFLWNCNLGEPATADRALDDGIMMAASTSTGIPDKIYQDPSGEVQVMVRTCPYAGSPASGPHCSYCELDNGWTMIGGGAEIEGSPPFARLRASFPVRIGGGHTDVTGLTCTGNTSDQSGTDETSWQARSDGSSAHRLRAYVIGLKIAGVNAQVSIEGHGSGDPSDPFPGTTCCGSGGLTTTPWAQWQHGGSQGSGGFLVGGGVNEERTDGDPHPPVCFLTESRPDRAAWDSWRGAAICSAPSEITAYHITLVGLDEIQQALGWDYPLERFIRTATASGTGYRTASVTAPYPWISGGFGGSVTATRYLADLVPLRGSLSGDSVTTKDQNVFSNGTTTAYSIGLLGGRWGTWRFNQIKFLNNSYFVRASGSAPVNLTQATANPPAPPSDGAYRWHLESVGSGQYRIRNSNPGNPAGGECVYRQSGVANLRVGACQSANDYKWTVPTNFSLNFIFKLRNVATGTCLSRTGGGGVTLATCNTAQADESNPQALFLNQWHWPTP